MVIIMNNSEYKKSINQQLSEKINKLKKTESLYKKELEKKEKKINFLFNMGVISAIWGTFMIVFFLIFGIKESLDYMNKHHYLYHINNIAGLLTLCSFVSVFLMDLSAKLRKKGEIKIDELQEEINMLRKEQFLEDNQKSMMQNYYKLNNYHFNK